VTETLGLTVEVGMVLNEQELRAKALQLIEQGRMPSLEELLEKMAEAKAEVAARMAGSSLEGNPTTPPCSPPEIGSPVSGRLRRRSDRKRSALFSDSQLKPGDRQEHQKG
jgi:hypothetical protein